MVPITLNHESVGSIAFVQPEHGFQAVCTVAGFDLRIPARLTFHAPKGSRLPLVLENLTAVFSIRNGERMIRLGAARVTQHFRSGYDDLPIDLIWDWSFAALAFYERLRAGRPPCFAVAISGDIRYVLPDGEPGREPVSVAIQFHQQAEVQYSRDAWVTMMRSLNLFDAIVVEIPFPSDPPTGWDSIWSAVREARDAFDSGNASGWNGCVSKVRFALEEWQKIEKENPGPGWSTPSVADRQARTKEQRLDALRWHLLQTAHLAHHSTNSDWSRDDALLALSTLTALLAVRKP